MYVGASSLWSELSCAPSHPPHVLGKVDCLCFDQTHSLLWAVAEDGRITVHTVPDLEVASSSCPFTPDDAPTGHGGVLDVAPLPQGRLLAMSSHCLALHNWTGTSAAMHRTNEHEYTSVAVLPGLSAATSCANAGVLLWDLQRLEPSGVIGDNASVSLVRSGPRNGCVAAADARGHIGILDPRSGDFSCSAVPAHHGGVNEICANSTFLVTCGFTDPSCFYYDATVQVFDTRQLAAPVATIAANPDAFAAALHPRLNATVLFVGTLPCFYTADCATGAIQNASEISTSGTALSAFALSPSGECAAFSSTGGSLHIWSTSFHNSNKPSSSSPKANKYGLPVVIPPRYTPPTVRLKEDDALCLPGFALLEATLAPELSSAEPKSSMRVGMPPRIIDADLLRRSAEAQMTSRKDVRTLRNPNFIAGAAPSVNAAAVAHLRNLRVAPTEAVADVDAQTAQRKALRRHRRAQAGHVLLPREYLYQSLPVRKKQKAYVDLDFAAQMTQTIFSGLENLLEHSYVNAILQVLYFEPELRQRVLANRPSAFSESLLLDELHFLFHMLLHSRRVPCQASNLLRVLCALSLAEGTDLLPSRSEADDKPARQEWLLVRRIVKLTDFVLSCLNREVGDVSTRASRLRGRSAAAAAAASVDRGAAHGISPRAAPGSPSAGSGDHARLRSASEAASLSGNSASTWVETMFSIKLESKLQCKRHPDFRSRTQNQFVLDLTYPPFNPDDPGVTFADVVSRSLRDERTLKMWFNDSLGYQVVHTSRRPVSLPGVLVIDTSMHKADVPNYWQAHEAGRVSGARAHPRVSAHQSPRPPFLPWALGISTAADGAVRVFQADTLEDLWARMHAATAAADAPSFDCYLLTASVSVVRDEDELEDESGSVADLEGSLVAEVRVRAPYVPQGCATVSAAAPMGQRTGSGMAFGAEATCHEPLRRTTNEPEVQLDGEPGTWVLFNDFTVKEVPPSNVRVTFNGQKLPALLFYTRADAVRGTAQAPPPPCAPACSETEFLALCRSSSIGRTPVRNTFETLDVARNPPGRNLVLALDAEFVALTPSQRKLVNGKEFEVKPMAMGLARVSAIVGNGAQAGVTVIDDHIAITSDVHDYLTKFSGLRPGDLHPATSPHYLTTLKRAYVKLKYLVDAGCVFVGHGLRQDFRMINIWVPPEQIVDTVELFRLPNSRMLSLRYLVSYLLRRQIQTETHDSVEDAMAALDLYSKYEELKSSGDIDACMHELYAFGQQCGWRPVVWQGDRPAPVPPEA